MLIFLGITFKEVKIFIKVDVYEMSEFSLTVGNVNMNNTYMKIFVK